jgi:ribosomal 30S subunit maturation factor RimM
MNKTVFILTLVSFLSLGLVASNSYAAGTTRGSGSMMFNSYDLLGVPVKDSHGEIGFVNEVMDDTGGHALAVIYHAYRADDDPFAYGGGVNTPVPFQELTITKTKGGREVAILKTDLEHLDLAPSLDSSKMESRRYEASIYQYYGIQPYGVRSGTPAKGTFMEVDSRDLVGAAVEDSCGKVIGVVNEVMVDSRGHAFAILNHGDYDLYGEGGANTPVPFEELQISQTKGGQDIVRLKTDTEHLDFAPYLDLTKINSRQYEANIYEYYGIQPYWTQRGE